MLLFFEDMKTLKRYETKTTKYNITLIIIIASNNIMNAEA